MEKEIPLDQKEHALEMLLEMNQLKKEQELCDFKIKVGSKEIPVHKLVLAASSPYFRAMLSQDNLETRSGVVEMKETDFESVEKCVDFIYTGKASVSDDKRADLMHIAHLLQLQKLCDGLAVFLEENLSLESFFHAKHMADTYNCRNLRKTCDKFALDNFNDLAQMEEFNCLDEKYLYFLIKETKLFESIKCKALIQWAMSDEEHRKKSFETIFNSLELTKISLSYQRYLAKNEKLIYNSNEILQKIIDSIFESMNVTEQDQNLTVISSIAMFELQSQTLVGYNPSDQTFNTMIAMNDAMISNGVSAVAVLGGDVYVWIGFGHIFCLDHVENEWKLIASSQFCSRNCLATVLEDFVYASPNDTYSQVLERYDHRNNIWERITDKNVSCYQNCLVANGRHVYSIGGVNQDNISLSTVERYDPRTGTWSDASAMKRARHSAAAVALSNKIYVFGGVEHTPTQPFRPNHGFYQGFYHGQNSQIAYTVLPDVEYLDPDIGSWTKLVNMSTPRSDFSACVLGANIFVFEGGAIQKFNPSEGKWEEEIRISSHQTFAKLCFALSLV